MVEPSLLALTSTPSIAPSSLEDTNPESAVCACAPLAATAAANTTASHECLHCMGQPPDDSFLPRLLRDLAMLGSARRRNRAQHEPARPSPRPMRYCVHVVDPHYRHCRRLLPVRRDPRAAAV